MKRKLIAAAAIAAMFSVPASAQMGPGMTGGGMMGPAMMGDCGMGPGMMGGYAPGGYGGLKLTDEQRAKIAEIQQDVSRKQWELMGKMHDQRYQLHEFESSGKEDDGAARKAFQAMTEAHKTMFENALDARKRVDALLTNEQRERLWRGWPSR